MADGIDNLAALKELIGTARGPRAVRVRSLTLRDCSGAFPMLTRLSHHHGWAVPDLDRVERASKLDGLLRAMLFVNVPRILAAVPDPDSDGDCGDDGVRRNEWYDDREHPIDVLNSKMQNVEEEATALGIVSEMKVLKRICHKVDNYFISNWPFRMFAPQIYGELQNARNFIVQF